MPSGNPVPFAGLKAANELAQRAMRELGAPMIDNEAQTGNGVHRLPEVII